MKSVSYRLSLLASCAAFSLCVAAHPAQALLAGQSDAPSIEIHLDVLNSLAPRSPIAARPAGSTAAEPAAPHKAAKKVAAKQAPAKKVAKKPVKETSVAAAQPEPDAVPKPEVKSSVAESPAALPPATTPQPAISASAAPAPAAAVADVPKLPESELKSTGPAPKQKGMLSGISGGFSDFLSSDSGPKTKPAEAAPAQPQKAPVIAATAAPVTPATANALPAPSSLAAPPPDLTAAAPASVPPAMPSDKDIPPAPMSLAAAEDKKNADSAPPLLTLKSAGEGEDKGPPKMVMASNDATPPLPPRLEASDTAKADLPLLPTPDGGATESPAKGAPEVMAQATLTPLPTPPAPAAVKPAPAPAPVPAPAMAATPSPAPVAAAAPAKTMTPAAAAPIAATPASALLPTPQTASGGPTPNLRVPFNETETDLPLASKDSLDAFAKILVQNPGTRVDILAYASGPETTGIYPKRVSLARGIAVRNYLTTNKGIDIERVNVKAMGNKNDIGGPGDRVDLYILK